jgi:membrane-bound lytic murein transglycosylase B
MAGMQKPSDFSASSRCRLVAASLAILALAGCASAPSVAPRISAPSTAGTHAAQAGSDEVEHSQRFARWVDAFSTIARTAGIDQATLHIAFDNVRFVPRVIELDRTQPEFTRNVWDYLDSALSR